MSPTPPRRYVLTESADLSQVLAGIESKAALEREKVEKLERDILDTFDWRLYSKGTALEDRRSGGRRSLVWRELESGELKGRLTLADEAGRARFAWDLPSAPIAARLADVVEMRALLTLTSLSSTVTTSRMLDDEGKTVARLVVDRTSMPDGRPLPTVVEVSPVRGYEEEADRLQRLLAAQVVLVAGAEDPVVLALRAAGHVPGSYSSKLDLRLEPEAPARQAWTEVLRVLLGTMRANEVGLRDGVDSEFLHDFRVAVRRTRTVASQAKGIFPEGPLEHFRQEFAWLGRLTGPARDLDVYLLEMPAFEAALPPERRSDLKPFVAFLERGQSEAHAVLVEELAGRRYRELVDSWQTFLEEPPASDGSSSGSSGSDPGPSAEPDALRPAAPVAAERIARAHRRLVRDGRQIKAGSAPESLHELRKDGKKLRYLLECFGSLFPGDEVAPIVKELKALQEVLGEYQDCQVQAGSIERFGEEMLHHGANGGDAVPASALLAMGSMIDRLSERERSARTGFDERFARFDSPGVRRAVRDLGEEEEEGDG